MSDSEVDIKIHPRHLVSARKNNSIAKNREYLYSRTLFEMCFELYFENMRAEANGTLNKDSYSFVMVSRKYSSSGFIMVLCQH